MSRIAVVALWYNIREPENGLTVVIDPADRKRRIRSYRNPNLARLNAILRIIFGHHQRFDVRPFGATEYTLGYIAERKQSLERRP